MSAIRKIVLSVSALFLAFSGMFLANMTANADQHTAGPATCNGQDWNGVPC